MKFIDYPVVSNYSVLIGRIDNQENENVWNARAIEDPWQIDGSHLKQKSPADETPPEQLFQLDTSNETNLVVCYSEERKCSVCFVIGVSESTLESSTFSVFSEGIPPW